MPAVFHHKNDVIVVDGELTARVKESARNEPMRRARLNLHHSEEDQVQEMLIAFCKDSLIYPHRHVGKSESMHVVEGCVLIIFFDDSGRVTRRLHLGPAGSGLPSLYRLAVPAWHTVIPLDEVVVIHETTSGPFRRERYIPPTWVPRDDEALRAFIAKLRQESEQAADGQPELSVV
jgi:cupin fold WbuC family metalloprotein